MSINGRDYGSAGGPSPEMHIETGRVGGSSKALNLGKVFGIMFIWLLVTAGLAFGFGYLFYNWLMSGGKSAENGLMAILVTSGISLIILTFIIQFFALKKGKGMIILSSLYVLCMGILCSSLVLFMPWYILGVALGITTAIFGVLSLIGFLARNVRPIAMIGFMIIIGAGITALITWLIILFTGISGQAVTFLWIVDFAMFAGMLLLIIVDLHNINKICERGEVSTNLTLYCALTLYSDFIYIFIKIAYYLALANGRK